MGWKGGYFGSSDVDSFELSVAEDDDAAAEVPESAAAVDPEALDGVLL